MRLGSVWKKHSIATRCLCGAVAILLLQGCSGTGCTRKSDDTTHGNERLNVQPSDILAHPVSFDAQNVEEMARLVAADRPLTDVEVAQAIVVAESAVNHLGQILDELARNDDPADSWNMMTELASLPWTAQTLDLVDGLDRQELDAVGRQRIDDLRHAVSYNQSMINQLHSQNKRLPVFFTPKNQ